MLIGTFDLDPNRGLSLLLDAWTAQPDNEAFLELLPLFRCERRGGTVGGGWVGAQHRIRVHARVSACRSMRQRATGAVGMGSGAATPQRHGP